MRKNTCTRCGNGPSAFRVSGKHSDGRKIHRVVLSKGAGLWCANCATEIKKIRQQGSDFILEANATIARIANRNNIVL